MGTVRQVPPRRTSMPGYNKHTSTPFKYLRHKAHLHCSCKFLLFYAMKHINPLGSIW
jgi:hypothetical protein